MSIYPHTETEIITLAKLADQHGMMLLTRVNPDTGKQQTLMGVRPVGEWRRLHIHTKPVCTIIQNRP